MSRDDGVVVDGYWTVPCVNGCDGTGRYTTPGLPDFGAKCVACKGTGRTLVVLARPHDWVPTAIGGDLLCVACLRRARGLTDMAGPCSG